MTQPPPQQRPGPPPWQPHQPPSQRQPPYQWNGHQQPQWGPPRYQPQPPAQEAPDALPVNVAAIISIVCGLLAVLGLLGPLIFTIVGGPVALISGCVGEYLATRRGWGLRWTAAAGVLLGTVCTLLAVVAAAG